MLPPFLSKLFKSKSKAVEAPEAPAPGPERGIRRSLSEPYPSSRHEFVNENSSSEEENEEKEEMTGRPSHASSRRGTIDVRTIAGARRSSSARTLSRLLAEKVSVCDNFSAGGLENALQNFCRIDSRHRGRNCTVMEAFSRQKGQRVIIKAFSVPRMTAAQRDKCRRELQLLDTASDVPNVMRLMGTTEDVNSLYTIVNVCPGVTLIEHMANGNGRITEEFCSRNVARPMLEALAGLHALGIVHRHIKPEHIICGGSSGGGSTLIDFTDGAITVEKCLNSREGELQYMAPEMLNKPCAEDVFHKVLFNGMAESELPQYTEKVDVWSLGVVILEALTGRQPFLADSIKEMIQVQQGMLDVTDADGMTPVFMTRHGLSALAVDFLAKAMQADPVRRHSAAELLLHDWLKPGPP